MWLPGELGRILAESVAQIERAPQRRRDTSTEVIVGWDAAVAEWVRQQLGGRDLDPFGKCTAIGIARGTDLIAGAVFYDCRPPNIELAIVASSPDWCSLRNVQEIFAYPFVHFQVQRLGARAGIGNARARRFLAGVGFEIEGIARSALPPTPATPSGDAMIFGMLRDECFWLDDEMTLRARMRARRRPALVN